MEQIIVNIRFNEEEKSEWIKYYARIDRFAGYSMPFCLVIVFGTLIWYMLALVGFEGTYLDITHSFSFLLTNSFIIKVCMAEMAIISITFELLAMAGRKRQDIAKHMIIGISPEGNMIDLSIERLKTHKVLYHDCIDVSEFLSTMCDKDNDKVLINNEEYIIGKNDAKYIYSDVKVSFHDTPATKPSDVNDIKDLIKLLSKFYRYQNY